MSPAIPSGNTETTTTTMSKQQQQPKLLHPLLNDIPQQIRFALQGTISNVIFMAAYNYAISIFHTTYEAATIYALVYLAFIPISHLLSVLIVFGWPNDYLKSLLSNCPIGLAAIPLGSACTAYLDNIEFNSKVESILSSLTTGAVVQDEDSDTSEFYSSLVVMAVTGIFTYVASVYVNSSPSTIKDDKKEL